MITEHSETYELGYNPPSVAQFKKVSFEQFKTAFNDLLTNYKNNISDAVTVDDAGLKKLYDMIELPVRATFGSAGYDFRTPINCNLAVGQTIVIPTGIRCKMQNNYVLQLYPRSGLGFKYGMELVNTVGIIDADYYNADNEGHIMIKIKPTLKDLQLKIGDKFAQGIFMSYGITYDDNASGVRSGGIGSTGN